MFFRAVAAVAVPAAAAAGAVAGLVGGDVIVRDSSLQEYLNDLCRETLVFPFSVLADHLSLLCKCFKNMVFVSRASNILCSEGLYVIHILVSLANSGNCCFVFLLYGPQL